LIGDKNVRLEVSTGSRQASEVTLPTSVKHLPSGWNPITMRRCLAWLSKPAAQVKICPLISWERLLRLADFILANVEPILMEWEAFARSIWPDALSSPATDPGMLRDHAEQILRATVTDMKSDQSSVEQSNKSKGEGQAGVESDRVTSASGQHGSNRVADRFELWAVVAEYRALRASVIRLWGESDPVPDTRDLVDLTRFNESIDQSLTEAVRSYTEQVVRDREALLADEQAARRQEEAANRAKDVFLATLSHEMRTPLNAIVGWLGIMRLKGCGEAEFAEGLDVIERNTQAQVKLIEDVLDVSRIVSGKLRLDIRDCDLVEVIDAGIAVVRPTAKSRDITLDVQLDPAASRASCDPTRIQQVMWNLLSNAIKFTPKGGTVRVKLVREQSSWRLSVSDNGQGISPELLPHIFDRFRQAESGTRRHFGGLGLGLSIVKHLTEMHGGTVEAHSPGEGHRATFDVRLPIRAVRFEETDLDASAETSGDDAMPPIFLISHRSVWTDCAYWLSTMKRTPAECWPKCWKEPGLEWPRWAAPWRRSRRLPTRPRKKDRTC
jgi:signal transduction histidine kinase